MVVDLIFYIVVLWPLIAPVLWIAFTILSIVMINEAKAK